jgi:hypothetical protein
MAPGFRDDSDFPQAGKPMFVEAFVSESPVEALAGSVLHRFSWLDEMVLDALLMAPLVEDSAGELRTIVCYQNLGATSLINDPVQHTSHPKAGKACVHLDGQAFPREGIYDIQGANRPTISQGIRGEVHGPLLIWSGRNSQFLPHAPL